MPEPTDSLPIRADGLEINVMHDGVVIYQRDKKKIHYLNHVAGLVLELCDGQNKVDDLAKVVGEACDLPQPPHEDVVNCIQDLRSKELIR